MKFKIWIILLFATSGHGFLIERVKKLYSYIDASDQGSTDVSIEKRQEKPWETQQSTSSNHGPYGNSDKENFEHPGVGADSGGNLNFGLSVSANIRLNSYGEISKIVQSGTNLSNRLYKIVKNKKVGQELNNQESAAKNQKSSDSDSKYYGYDSKSGSFDEDSSSREFDGQYQSQDQKLFNSDPSQYQGHESGQSFGLNNQNYHRFDPYSSYEGYQSENQQLVSSYPSGHQGYGSKVQSNVEQGTSDYNQNQYSSNKDQVYEKVPRNGYSQSQSLEEPKWSEHSKNEELRNDDQLNSQTHGHNFVNGLISSYSAQIKEPRSENGAGSNFVHQPMHSGESKSLNHKLTINCTQYGMHSNSANYEQNKDLGLGFNNKLIKYQQQDNGNPIELYEGSSKHFGHMTEENFVEVRDKNSAINKQSHEQFGQSSIQSYRGFNHEANLKVDIGSSKEGKLSDLLKAGKKIGKKVVHKVHAVRTLGKNLINSAFEKAEGTISKVGNGASNLKVTTKVKTSHNMEKSRGYDASAAEEHKSSYGYQAHSSETGYGNHDNSEGSAKYEQQRTVDSHQVPLTSVIRQPSPELCAFSEFNSLRPRQNEPRVAEVGIANGVRSLSPLPEFTRLVLSQYRLSAVKWVLLVPRSKHCHQERLS
ncbi:hypothetical protein KQX54_007785 [Cotesia glomerata]|uniref:Uncharacterized protein n=1 Tax=Cotesia glomerata TaxID=32391 RepID=A0AAV7HUC2_COTGL|nr:hypothetical protein KQX54_007785 [Cotesia glomerata]